MSEFLGALGDIFTSPAMYASAVRLGAFLAFAALGELVAEKAGTINISVEGSLLAGALGGAVVFDLSGSTVVGLVGGAAAGVAVAMVAANMSHRLTADQFVVGITANVLVLGLAGFLDATISPLGGRAGVVTVPLLSGLPVIGPALFEQTWPTYLLYGLIPLTWWLLYRTRWGLEVRSAGEHPQAADVSGIDVNQRRREAIYYGGTLAGLGGAFLVLGQVGSFDVGAVGGRGFIAIAAVYFGGWTLRGTLIGALLFGMADAFRLAVPVLGYQANAQLLAALPYLLTLAVMYFITTRFVQPAALAKPFVRGLR